MKSLEKRIERATTEVADRLRGHLADIRSLIGAKHQLAGVHLDGAMLMGFHELAAEYQALSDRLVDAAAKLPTVDSSEAAGAR